MSNFGTILSGASPTAADTDRHHSAFNTTGWTNVPPIASGYGVIPGFSWTVDRAGTYFVMGSIDCQTKTDNAGGSVGGALTCLAANGSTILGNVGFTQQILGNNNFPPANSRRTILVCGFSTAAVNDVLSIKAAYVGGSAANNIIQSTSRMVIFEVGA